MLIILGLMLIILTVSLALIADLMDKPAIAGHLLTVVTFMILILTLAIMVSLIVL